MGPPLQQDDGQSQGWIPRSEAGMGERAGARDGCPEQECKGRSRGWMPGAGVEGQDLGMGARAGARDGCSNPAS